MFSVQLKPNRQFPFMLITSAPHFSLITGRKELSTHKKYCDLFGL